MPERAHVRHEKAHCRCGFMLRGTHSMVERAEAWPMRAQSRPQKAHSKCEILSLGRSMSVPRGPILCRIGSMPDSSDPCQA